MPDGKGVSLPLTGLEEAAVVSRPNRFVAVVRLGGREVTAHVADSGRLEELIFPGNTVLVRHVSRRAARATSYDLVLARHDAGGAAPIWVSVDTRYPNRIFGQALRDGAIPEFSEYGEALPEYRYHKLSPWREEVGDVAGAEGMDVASAAGGAAGAYGNDGVGGASGNDGAAGDDGLAKTAKIVRSRMDFFLPGDDRLPHALVEVKSVTLCVGGTGLFPDAPTDRGVRHLRELTRAAREGYRAFAVFIAQREDVEIVRLNRETDPAFAGALKDAAKKGVVLLGYRCWVSPEEIRLDLRPVRVDAGI